MENTVENSVTSVKIIREAPKEQSQGDADREAAKAALKNMPREFIQALAMEELKEGGDFNTEKSQLIPENVDNGIPAPKTPTKKKVFKWTLFGLAVAYVSIFILTIAIMSSFFYFIIGINIIKSLVCACAIVAFRKWWWGGQPKNETNQD